MKFETVHKSLFNRCQRTTEIYISELQQGMTRPNLDEVRFGSGVNIENIDIHG